MTGHGAAWHGHGAAWHGTADVGGNARAAERSQLSSVRVAWAVHTLL
eukprot:SAG11_NODE_38484_length_252_cov_0.673203_1_plen_46_part_10